MLCGSCFSPSPVQVYQFSEPWGPSGNEKQQEDKLSNDTGELGLSFFVVTLCNSSSHASSWAVEVCFIATESVTGLLHSTDFSEQSLHVCLKYGVPYLGNCLLCSCSGLHAPFYSGHGLEKPREAIRVDPPAKSVQDDVIPETERYEGTKESENSKAEVDKDSSSSTKGAGNCSFSAS